MTGTPDKAKSRKRVPLGHVFLQIGSLTAVSRVVGFIRDIAFASFLGAGPATDAFLVAFKNGERISVKEAIKLLND